MKGARSRSGSWRNTSRDQFQPFSTSSGVKAILARQSEASSVSVVGIGVVAGGIGARSEVGAMRIRHVGEKFNWIGVESGWVILRATELGGMVGDFFSGTLPHPQKTTVIPRQPNQRKGLTNGSESFSLDQVVTGPATVLEVCIGAVRPDTFHQVRVDIVCRNGCSICAEICICIHDSG